LTHAGDDQHPGMDDGDPDPAIPVPEPWHRGRGSAGNPRNRFERLASTWDLDFDPAADPDPRTEFLDDDSQGILVRNDSPDVPFAVGLNAYRGCEHGCSYCYARPYHEYLGMSAGLDFERRILVKRRASELLRKALASPRWTPQTVAMSGVTDCYQPVERRLRLTRACLAVFAEFANPVGLITKNALVSRDADLLGELARHQAVSVCLSLTTLDPAVARGMEPRASDPQARLAAIRALVGAGVPVGVNVAPVVPGLTEHELPAILAAAAAAGARFAGYQVLRLPHGVGGIFTGWLRHHHPTRADTVLARLASLHAGALDAAPGRRMRGDGAWAGQIAQLFALGVRRAGLSTDWPALSTAAFRPAQGRQLSIFDPG
jgi:DNA repair photolyase